MYNIGLSGALGCYVNNEKLKKKINKEIQKWTHFASSMSLTRVNNGKVH